MLIGCITGPDFKSAKRQIAKANLLCDGAELRLDLCQPVSFEEAAKLLEMIEGTSILTGSTWDLPSDYLTLDWNEPSKKTSVKIIRAYHNFKETPENLAQLLEKALQTDVIRADVIKIATMANSTLDALRMLLFLKDHSNVCGICMGECGQITRVLGPIFGNVFDFVAIETPAAPGQLSIEELLETYHYRKINKDTQIYGLIGDPIAQSPSHQTHNRFFRENEINAVYIRMRVKKSELSEFFPLAKQIGIAGLSVTIPHKREVLPYIEEPQFKAVNTLRFEQGKIYGVNTDGKAALDVIEEKYFVEGKTITILGGGGSSLAIAYEAKKREAKVRIWCRREIQAKAAAKEVGCGYGVCDETDILINTTPISDFTSDIEPKLLYMDINIAHPLGKRMFEKQALGQFQYWFKRAIQICLQLDGWSSYY